MAAKTVTAEAGQESGLVRFLPITAITPSSLNDRLYRPVDPQDPEIVALAESIRQHGVLQPLVVTLDHVILSGHRRHTAARLAGLETVPCTIDARHSSDPGFLTFLREHNRQREKNDAERLREEVVSATRKRDTGDCWNTAAKSHRSKRSSSSSPARRPERP